MTFSPKFLVFGAVLISVRLATVLLAGPSAAAGPAATGQVANGVANAASGPPEQSQPASQEQGQGHGAVLGSAIIDMNLLVKQDNVGEADNVRWSLARSSPAGGALYNASRGVDWAALRKLSLSGSIRLPAGASWSFNDTYGGGAGYKVASGVLAGGQCSLATAFRAAAMKAGLETKATPHRRPIPGFPQNETVNIWWGTYDLVIKNTSGRDLSMDWQLAPVDVKISIR